MTELPEEDSPIDIIRAVDSLQAADKHFQQCIYCVEELLLERENLIKEFILMKEPLHQAIGDLKAELLKLYQTKSKAEIECDNFKEEIACTKKKLFDIIKAQMACKYKLDCKKQDLPRITLEREVLESKVQVLSDELAVLKNHHHEEISQIIHRLENSQNTNDALSLAESRQTSGDFRSFLGEQRQCLEKYYEPKLEKLMRWSKTRAESLQHTQQEIRGFIKQLQPLQEQVAKLNTQGRCLEQQLQLRQRKWAEDVLQYQGQKRELEVKVTILKSELAQQKEKNSEIKYLKGSLSEELSVYKNFCNPS
uniref:syncoilin isoform X2 n=1 Tax=Pristiophorus japonicus TaxID=55135 RepID=UPI00398F2D26